MKRSWKELALDVVLLILVIAVSTAASCYFTNIMLHNQYGESIIHDNGCERIMTVYSNSGEMLQRFTGFIGVMKSDGNVTSYDYDGGCISIQGGIVIVEDIY